MIELDEFKKVSLDAVGKAQESILYYFHNLPKIETKVDMTPVTRADKEAEEIIVDTIKKKFPSHGFMGEELGNHNERAEFVWVIDPIDGTKNFIHGLNFYGTVLGLLHQGKIILGISNMPALGELLYASVDEPTVLNGKRVRVSSIDTLSQAFVTTGGIKGIDKDKFRQVLIKLEKSALSVRGYGDLHGYHLVASGRADVMLEPKGAPWDFSAFQIIIKQAGGMYSDFSGNEFGMGPTSLASNGMLHGLMLDLVKHV